MAVSASNILIDTTNKNEEFITMTVFPCASNNTLNTFYFELYYFVKRDGYMFLKDVLRKIKLYGYVVADDLSSFEKFGDVKITSTDDIKLYYYGRKLEIRIPISNNTNVKIINYLFGKNVSDKEALDRAYCHIYQIIEKKSFIDLIELNYHVQHHHGLNMNFDLWKQLVEHGSPKIKDIKNLTKWHNDVGSFMLEVKIEQTDDENAIAEYMKVALSHLERIVDFSTGELLIPTCLNNVYANATNCFIKLLQKGFSPANAMDYINSRLEKLIEEDD